MTEHEADDTTDDESVEFLAEAMNGTHQATAEVVLDRESSQAYLRLSVYDALERTHLGTVNGDGNLYQGPLEDALEDLARRTGVGAVWSGTRIRDVTHGLAVGLYADLDEEHKGERGPKECPRCGGVGSFAPTSHPDEPERTCPECGGDGLARVEGW